MLLATGAEEIAEANPADSYWGIGGDGVGLNEARQDHRPHPRGIAGGGGLTMWRASVLAVFPEIFSRALGREPCRQGAGVWHMVA